MKFNRAKLEALEAALSEARDYVRDILEVFPYGCEAEVTIDFFTTNVVSLELTGTSFPVCDISDECGLLQTALEQVTDRTEDVFPEYAEECEPGEFVRIQ